MEFSVLLSIFSRISSLSQKIDKKNICICNNLRPGSSKKIRCLTLTNQTSFLYSDFLSRHAPETGLYLSHHQFLISHHSNSCHIVVTKERKQQNIHTSLRWRTYTQETTQRQTRVSAAEVLKDFVWLYLKKKSYIIINKDISSFTLLQTPPVWSRLQQVHSGGSLKARPYAWPAAARQLV